MRCTLHAGFHALQDACSPPCVARCMLVSMRCTLHACLRALHVACLLPCVAGCMLTSVRCTLHACLCALHVACLLPCVARCILASMCCTSHILLIACFLLHDLPPWPVQLFKVDCIPPSHVWLAWNPYFRLPTRHLPDSPHSPVASPPTRIHNTRPSLSWTTGMFRWSSHTTSFTV